MHIVSHPPVVSPFETFPELWHPLVKQILLHFCVFGCWPRMGGKRLDELADGRLDTVLDECFSDLQEQICFGLSAQMFPIAGDQLEVLLCEMSRAVGAITAWLTKVAILQIQ
jgi:hypothetical protein